ncbi:MAG: hypothetical protein ROZ09_07650 [Thiobacillus sp.]|uniref:hypothetical protein n=1 Tax=Thiobacillus sp. TaxID=924 RepID=UPI0028942CD1|nr:hypothetical protein [Thiobacillus sp.]MDT3706689.1 hypothetical protein [Thiobacillus sp.]
MNQLKIVGFDSGAPCVHLPFAGADVYSFRLALQPGGEDHRMGFEYMFFDEALRDRFVDFAAKHGIASTVRKDEIEGFVVELPDGLADDQQEAVDAEYDSIMDQQMLLAESDEELVSHHVAGLTVTLADGSTRDIRIPPPIARRLLEHFTTDEIHEIATVIAESVANPIDGPLCRKP